MTFGYVFPKEYLCDCCLLSEDKIDEAIKAYLLSILRNVWFKELNLLEICIQNYIDVGGDYYFEHSLD